MTEFHCRKCHAQVAKKDENILYFSGCLMTLPHHNPELPPLKLAIPCETADCDETFYFEYPKRCSQKVIAKPLEVVL